MYHGTSLTAARKIEEQGFAPSDRGELGPGVYLVDEHNVGKAKRFAHDAFNRFRGTERATAENEPALVKCRVSVKKHQRVSAAASAGDWRSQGFDACFAERTSASASGEWCVASSAQVTVDSVQDLRGTSCPWGSWCPYTKQNRKLASSPWGGVCPCESLAPAEQPLAPLSARAARSRPAAQLAAPLSAREARPQPANSGASRWSSRALPVRFPPRSSSAAHSAVEELRGAPCLSRRRLERPDFFDLATVSEDSGYD